MTNQKLVIEEQDGSTTEIEIEIDDREISRLRARVAYEQRRRHAAEARAETAEARVSQLEGYILGFGGLSLPAAPL